MRGKGKKAMTDNKEYLDICVNVSERKARLRQVFVRDDHDMLLKRCLTKEGGWLVVEEGAVYPDECLFDVNLDPRWHLLDFEEPEEGEGVWAWDGERVEHCLYTSGVFVKYTIKNSTDLNRIVECIRWMPAHRPKPPET